MQYKSLVDTAAIGRHFHDKESEVRHWKSRYYDLQDTLKETEASLHEFMESSKELEREMDREINAANTKSTELQLKSEKLKGDVDEWKVRSSIGKMGCQWLIHIIPDTVKISTCAHRSQQDVSRAESRALNAERVPHYLQESDEGSRIEQ